METRGHSGKWKSKYKLRAVQNCVSSFLVLEISDIPNAQASQVAPVVKNPPARAGDIRDMGSILGQEASLEESMATHSSILAWRIPMDRGAWQAAVHRVTKSGT